MREAGIQITNLESEKFYETKSLEEWQQENTKHSKS